MSSIEPSLTKQTLPLITDRVLPRKQPYSDIQNGRYQHLDNEQVIAQNTLLPGRETLFYENSNSPLQWNAQYLHLSMKHLEGRKCKDFILLLNKSKMWSALLMQF